MEFKNKLEDRLNSVLIIDKLSNPNRYSKILSTEIANLLGEFMMLISKPEVDILVDNSGKYKIQIVAYANELKQIGF